MLCKQDNYALGLLSVLVIFSKQFLIPVAYAQVARSLEKVIVTARKREENLQNTPIAATALTAAEIRDAALPDLSSIAAYTPNLNVSVGAYSGRAPQATA